MPHKHDDLEPLNREPPVTELISSFLTRKDGYDRNHGPIPHIDASKHRVRVEGAVANPLDLSVSQLRHDFPQHTVTCVLQCAGNRRHTMRTLLKEVSGLDWFDSAVMNCKWSGPRLTDVLARVGVEVKGEQRSKAHVAFECRQQICQDDEWYGGSIGLERALRESAEVILALDMNDEPLTPEHGFPVRVVTPGIAGARAVKWLDRISVQLEESPNHYQQRDYKVLPEDATDAESAAPYWDKVPALQDMPVNSVVAVPANGATVALSPQGMVEVKGYALPGGESGPVTKVEVSGDDSRTWTEAKLLSHPDDGKWTWKLWEAMIGLEPGSGKRVLSRATDAGGNVQVEKPAWNLRGVAYNGYGETRDLTVVEGEET
ncbi:hypothetical protein LTR28_001604 [Elasticomyces elasticus]|nr:hypothetical protein LTR28_001604 [Elasticomyces elasticus]